MFIWYLSLDVKYMCFLKFYFSAASQTFEECYAHLYQDIGGRGFQTHVLDEVRHVIKIDMPIHRKLLLLAAKALGLFRDMGFLDL